MFISIRNAVWMAPKLPIKFVRLTQARTYLGVGTSLESREEEVVDAVRFSILPWILAFSRDPEGNSD